MIYVQENEAVDHGCSGADITVRLYLRYVLIGNENREIAASAFEGCPGSRILISFVGKPSNLPTNISRFAESHGYQFVGGYGENR